jgi:hypothetical protein
VTITMQVEATKGEPATVEYRWDTDTAILIANFPNGSTAAAGMSGSIEISGTDGSWLILDVQGGYLEGVEVAVWPEVTRVPALRPPAGVASGRVRVSAERQEPGVALLQMETTLAAEADQDETVVHFKVGSGDPARTLRVARDVLVDLGDGEAINGIWLLNVPRFPDDEE